MRPEFVRVGITGGPSNRRARVRGGWPRHSKLCRSPRRSDPFNRIGLACLPTRTCGLAAGGIPLLRVLGARADMAASQLARLFHPLYAEGRISTFEDVAEAEKALELFRVHTSPFPPERGSFIAGMSWDYW